jgi:serine/threonine-protein kinase HipA
MSRTLDGYLDRDLVGQLTQDQGAQMSVTYAPSWLGSEKRRLLSRSLPLREEAYSQKECRGFFAGTLPEEGNRKVIARILGIIDLLLFLKEEGSWRAQPLRPQVSRG